MPWKPLQPCPEPGCAARTTGGPCDQHRGVRERRRRGTFRERGYTSQWDHYSKYIWLPAHPLCGMRSDGELHAEHSRCVQAGRVVSAQCTDHIIAIENGGSMWEELNHQSLCLACNTWKSQTIDHPARRAGK